MKISVVVPCFNEEAVIRETNEQLNTVLSSHFDDYEIIYINDGSSDKTKMILTELKSKTDKLKLIHFSRNFGHQPAVTAGIHHAIGDYIIIIDADLQDPPGLIPDMVEKAKLEQANVVYAVRKSRDGETWFKLFMAKNYYRLINKLSEDEFPKDTGDFRLIDRKVADIFKSMNETHKYIRGLISWIGYKQVPIYYQRDGRHAGESHYTLLKLIQLACRGLLFSKKPLTLISNFGFLMTAISFVIIILQVLKLIIAGVEFSDNNLILNAVIFFGGIQLLCFGMIGTYIGNIFDQAKNRPEFIIDEIN
jgi:polyisoprenyl-phosphate glycosyltransferase